MQDVLLAPNNSFKPTPHRGVNSVLCATLHAVATPPRGGLTQALDPSMSNPTTDTEFKLWGDADLRQKSYVVQILHWFHYRPARLKASWKQEEVLTWELIRAFDILPQRLFLRPLLSRLASSSGQVDLAIRSLGESRIKITPYPSLELSGNKRNCKSDIGLGSDGRPTIWIEVKTASFRTSDLETQLQQQESSMALLLPDTPKALITLLPESRALSSCPNLSWDDVLAALRSFEHEVPSVISDPELSYGYCLLASELAERIESHPNRAKGWV